MNILIVKLSAIGDVIHTLPALNAIRSAYPSVHISWLIEEAAAPLIIGHESLDRVIVSGRKRWIKELRQGKWRSVIHEASALLQALRDTRYDLVFDFQALLKSSVLIGLSKGRRKIGFDRGMEHQEHSFLFLNERIPPVDMNHHAILRSLMMLDAVGIHSRKIDYRLPVHDDDNREVANLLSEAGMGSVRPLICINPVAKWPTKLWPNDHFATLADRLYEKFGVPSIFTGAPEDAEVVQDILSRMRHPAVDMTGKTTLKTLAALYKKADVLISTDTGPMHLGAAVKTPVVALFGPTAPWRTGPMGDRHRVIRAGLPCSPCFKRQCPTCDCMNHIGVEPVLAAVDSIVSAMTRGTSTIVTTSSFTASG